MQNQKSSRSAKIVYKNNKTYVDNNSSLLRKHNGFEQRYQAEYNNNLGDTAQTNDTFPDPSFVS